MNCNKLNQVPVACKACPCGHSFFNARRTTRVLSPSSDFRRRTQRVRREKPNYYDALEYDKQVRKVSSKANMMIIYYPFYCYYKVEAAY